MFTDYGVAELFRTRQSRSARVIVSYELRLLMQTLIIWWYFLWYDFGLQTFLILHEGTGLQYTSTDAGCICVLCIFGKHLN